MKYNDIGAARIQLAYARSSGKLEEWIDLWSDRLMLFAESRLCPMTNQTAAEIEANLYGLSEPGLDEHGFQKGQVQQKNVLRINDFLDKK